MDAHEATALHALVDGWRDYSRKGLDELHERLLPDQPVSQEEIAAFTGYVMAEACADKLEALLPPRQ